MWILFNARSATSVTQPFCLKKALAFAEGQVSTFRRRRLTVFENHRKSLIQHCERSELHLHLSGPKLIKNVKNSPFGEFLTNLKLLLPDRSILI